MYVFWRHFCTLGILPSAKHYLPRAAACLILLATVLGTDEAKPARAGKSQEYAQSFRGVPGICPGWDYFGPGAEEYVRFKPEGLRITVPASTSGRPQGLGVASQLSVQGDFEITTAFEIRHESAPEEAGKQTRFSIEIMLDRTKPYRNMAAISRKVGPNGGQFSAWQVLSDERRGVPEDTQWHGVDTPVKAGRLRLRRSGAVLSYFVAEGTERDDFALLRELPFGADDLKQMRLVASAGGPKAAIDVRVTDFHVRADALPNLNEIQPVGMGQRTEQKRTMRGAILGVVAVVALLTGLGVWLFARRRRRSAGGTAEPG